VHGDLRAVRAQRPGPHAGPALLAGDARADRRRRAGCPAVRAAARGGGPGRRAALPGRGEPELRRPGRVRDCGGLARVRRCHRRPAQLRGRAAAAHRVRRRGRRRRL
ncbi:MAG: hypothetical protein AVDCRST_MAG16-989, partial [uncultured Frankineae bacterium]